MRSASVSFAAATLVVDYEPDVVGPDDIRRRIGSLGYGVTGLSRQASAGAPPGAGAGSAVRRRFSVDAATVAAAAALTLAGALAERLGPGTLGPGAAGAAPTVLYALAIAAGGRQIARRAVAAVGLRTLDMNVLMTAAVIGAAILGEWSEGASVVVLFALGNALENRTLARARRSLRELVELAPATATVRRQGVDSIVEISQIAVGELVAVRPGERVPADGIVVEGASSVTEAAITGEALPVPKEPGDEVWAGSMNEQGFLVVRTTCSAADNTIARITHLIEEAQASKAPTERTVERFSRLYTPAVLAVAVVLAVVPPLLGAPLAESVRRALVMLVIACPCALVISTPVSVVSALSSATRAGAVVKGGRYLEALARVEAVAFDKTGTLTAGRPVVERIVTLGALSEDEVLRKVAAVERRSHHPVARAIVRLADARGIPDVGAVSFASVTGLGVEAEVEGSRLLVGSPAFLQKGGCTGAVPQDEVAALESAGKTVVLAGGPEGCLAILVVADPVRPGAAEALQELRRVGVSHIAMLTGDSARTALAAAEGLALDEVLSGLMPEAKVVEVERLAGRYRGVAMVGDGINDAPALAASTVGIAMGVAGSDTALETADVALMGDELHTVAFLVRLARMTVARIRENVALSVLIKVVFLGLAATGRATMWMAVFADMGTALLVTLNGMRLLGARPTCRAREAPGT